MPRLREIYRMVIARVAESAKGAVKSSPTAASLKNQTRLPERDPKDTYMKRLENAKLDYPVRDQLAKHGKPVTLLTNHFQLVYNTKKPIVLYEFRVNELENKAERKARAMMESIVANCAVLRDNRASFATDYFCTIVAWVDLRTLFDQTNADGTHYLLNIRDGPLDLRMNLRFERQVDMQDLLRYAKIDTAAVANPTEDLETMTNLFNIIISECAEQSDVGTIPGGGNKFYRKDAHAGLQSDSLCTHRGYSYSVKAGVGSVLLNINTLTSAFWRPVNLASVMNDDRTWGGMDFNTFSGVIAGLRVYILYNRGNKKNGSAAYERLNSKKGRTKTIVGLGQDASTQNFEVEPGVKTTVEAHFLNNYHQRLEFPDLPVVNLGSRQQPIWYPAEKLQILAYQKLKGLVPSKLISRIQTIACQRPPVAKALVVLEGLETLGATRNMTNPFRLPVCSMFSLRPFLLKVGGGILDAPTICYSDDSTVPSDGGSWIFPKQKFYQCKYKEFNAQVVHESSVTREHADVIAENLVHWAGKYDVARVNISRTAVVLHDSSPKKMIEGLNKIESGSTLAILILERKNISTYSVFKDLCDRKYGLHAICLTRPKCQKKDQGNTWSNITLKMNLKAEGINHTVKGNVIKPEGTIMKSILVLGADVTHPGPGSVPGCPSVAAIVGSVDHVAGRFLGSMRLQKVPRAEIIDEVEAMVSERIRDWVEEMSPSNADYLTLPTTIIYYRDGVSESMYAEVKRVEIKAIRDAFNAVVDKYTRSKKIDPSRSVIPKIVAIICGKRHHVRFYPSDDKQADHTQNCRPGTVVDDVVTSPYYQNFYLQSHKAIIGTASPAHYFVIENELKLSMEALRIFTHELCYTYVRAPVGVSYAAPAYYADRLCERGRCYLRSFFVAPKGSDVRKDYDEFRDKEELLLKSKRDPNFDPKKLPNFDPKKFPKRIKKSQDLVNKEKKDALAVRKRCDEHIMRKAKSAFEEFNQGGNPWHRNLDKTMFWM